MGKKSKRRTTTTSITEDNNNSKQQRNIEQTNIQNKNVTEEETKDNLRFEDPFEDEFEKENEDDDDDDDDDVVDNNNDGNNNDETMEDSNNNSKASIATVNNMTNNNDNNNDSSSKNEIKSWNPLTSSPLEPGTTLEIDETAYKMHHALTPEWPSLSFDIINDTNGTNRTRFPHSMIAVTGSQTSNKNKNKVTVMKLSDMARTGGGVGRLGREKTEKELDDEILGEEIDKSGYGDDDDDEDEEKEESNIEEEYDDDIDMDPILEHFNLNHDGGVNRVRAIPQGGEIVATWSDNGNVNLYNIGSILDGFAAASEGGSGTKMPRRKKISKDPFFTYEGHSTEGYAMDWSKVTKGNLATGDCHGNIHLWQPTVAAAQSTTPIWNNSSFDITSNAYQPSSGGNIDNPSVEDIQWSPTEATVFATAECGGYVRIYDTRCKGRPMLTNKIHENGSDVNVLSWNSIVSNLMATGGDDGTLSVWDLRNFQASTPTKPSNPLARFTCHQKPITSLEWHPTDESMIVVSDEDGTFVYDLSIEEDIDENDGSNVVAATSTEDGEPKIPPQLLFVHCGSKDVKEVHWHPQITSLIMTTALSGYSVFIPSNL